MIDRRELLTLGGVIGALTPAGSPDEGVAAGAGQISDRQVQEKWRSASRLVGSREAKLSISSITC